MERNMLFGSSSDMPLSGRYCFPVKIPYYTQFASPELIYSYLHEHFDGRQDPRWREYGTEDVEEYCFLLERSLLLPSVPRLVNATILLLPVKGDMLSLCMDASGQTRSVKRFCFTILQEDFQNCRKMQ